MTEAEAFSGNVVVNLLDTSRRQVLQKWLFESASVVTIGRSPEREIVIPDARISRLHVVLQYRENTWFLMSMGQNGVQVEGEPVDNYPLTSGATFRLGRQGPLLEFRVVPTGRESLSQTLVDPLLDAADNIELDENKLNDDVQEIVEGDFFQNLLDRADQLRRDVSEQ